MSVFADGLRRQMDDWQKAVRDSGAPGLNFLEPPPTQDRIDSAFAGIAAVPCETTSVIHSWADGQTAGVLHTVTALAPIGVEALSLQEAVDGYNEFIANSIFPGAETHPGWFPILYYPKGYVLVNTLANDIYPREAVRVWSWGEFLRPCHSLEQVLSWWTHLLKDRDWSWNAELAGWNGNIPYEQQTDDQQGTGLIR